jgi:F-type H+-transporting ATPase subunit alpha
VQEFEKGLYQFLDANHPELARSVMETHELPPEREQELEAAIKEFKQTVGF